MYNGLNDILRIPTVNVAYIVCLAENMFVQLCMITMNDSESVKPTKSALSYQKNIPSIYIKNSPGRMVAKDANINIR